MKPFSKWKILDVEKEFQVQQQSDFNLLNEWLDGDDHTTPLPTESLMSLQKRLIKHFYDWNEQELKIRFIGPIIDLVDFDQADYQPFFEREISVSYNNEKLAGEVDFLVAKGARAPEQPYFFIHEHKKEADATGDPLGQVMIAMIVAQILNQTEHPIYGAYIVGRLWNFVVLHGKEYAVSLGYDATKDDIYGIYNALKEVKAYINTLIQQQPLST
ncbi:MAG: hypothetical protein AAF639_40730 [Chloroflexota bacterium]